MKKFYTVLLSMLAFACISMSAENLGTKYTGNVTISLDPTEPIVVEQSVYLKPTGTGLSTFALYDFKLDPAMPQPMGNIVVENVTTTNVYAEGSTNYKKYVGSADGIKLDLEGSEINASAQIEGYESIDGTLAVTINVIWHMDAILDASFHLSKQTRRPLLRISEAHPYPHEEEKSSRFLFFLQEQICSVRSQGRLSQKTCRSFPLWCPCLQRPYRIRRVQHM